MTGETIVQPGKPPPRLFMGLMNALPRLVLRSPLHGLMSKNVLLFTFSGRKSGKEYTTPMSYVRDGDGTVLMSTESPLWKNLVGGRTRRPWRGLPCGGASWSGSASTGTSGRHHH